jgi:tetratricopeptide (TPR) repeat protein
MLLDFNLAQHQELGQAAATLGGTVAYMAPEHLRALASRDPAQARRVDHRADIYSLGMVLFEMLAGRGPFDQSASYSPVPALIEAMAVERGRSTPSLRAHRADAPWSLESIARKCLAPDPAARYQQAEHLAEDLRRFLEDRPLRYAPELSWRERARKWVRRHPRLATSSAVTAVASLVLVTGANLYLGARANLSAAQARAYEAEGGEARDVKHVFEQAHQRALCLINTTTDLGDHVRQGRAECERALGLYGVLERDDWQDHPLWRRLPAADRERMAEDVRELLLLLARARTYLTAAEAGPVPRTAGAFLLPLLPSPGGPAGGAASLAAAQALAGPEAERLRAAADAALRDALLLVGRAEAVHGLPPSAALWEDRADYLERLGDAAGSWAARDRAQQIPLRDVRDFYRYATTLAFRGRPAEAAKALDRALKLNPKHYWSRLQRGLCRSALGEHELALRDFGGCVALWPEFPWGYFNCGRLEEQLGKLTEAAADYSAALKYDPAFVDAYVNRGLVYLQLRRHAEALADLDRAAGLGQDNARLHASRATALEGLGRTAEADAAFARASRLDPDNVPMRLARAFAVYQRLPGQARELFTAVLQKEPRNATALYGLGMLAAQTDRRSPEAVAYFGQALEADPTFVPARRGRANVLAHRGDQGAAHRDMAWCVKADHSGVTLYAGACVYALLAGQAADAARLQWCRENALDLLAGALQLGYGADLAADDADLEALRELPRFQRIVSRSKLR